MRTQLTGMLFAALCSGAFSTPEDDWLMPVTLTSRMVDPSSAHQCSAAQFKSEKKR